MPGAPQGRNTFIRSENRKKVEGSLGRGVAMGSRLRLVASPHVKNGGLTCCRPCRAPQRLWCI